MFRGEVSSVQRQEQERERVGLVALLYIGCAKSVKHSSLYLFILFVFVYGDIFEFASFRAREQCKVAWPGRCCSHR